MISKAEGTRGFTTFPAGPGIMFRKGSISNPDNMPPSSLRVRFLHNVGVNAGPPESITFGSNDGPDDMGARSYDSRVP
jgi:hypothetical protein